MRRPKFKLPKRENRPFRELSDPKLPPKLDVATDAPEVCAACNAWIPLPTLTKESCGDSTEKESLPFCASFGPEDTPLIPWRVR